MSSEFTLIKRVCGLCLVSREADMPAPTLVRPANETWKDWLAEFQPNDLIRQMRIQRGWSQDHLAELLEIDRTVLNGWETKRRSVSKIEHIYKLAWAFQVPVGLFFGSRFGDGSEGQELASDIAKLPAADKSFIIEALNRIKRS